ncbi:nuclease-related domain-containing protein [Amnibacterium endophyticum]|uniref:Nuclease-related domain-containing protein n=1 Tax=Amnibacterium endophyticum TaxID=2109337 RepID=A0ABW4LJ63_9MICO
MRKKEGATVSLSEHQHAPDLPEPILTLRGRVPGHAAMTYLLTQMDLRGSADSIVPADLRSWHVGVIGEQIVGHELAFLPSGWHVLHAVPAGSAGADIDHLVIGPGGVFVINTKHHADKTIRVGEHVVWINGFEQSGYQRELLRRCDEVSTSISAFSDVGISVTPLLVFVRARRLASVGVPRVAAVTSAGVVGYLTSRPEKLSSEQVQQIADAAALPATWGADADAAQEPDPTARFLELRTVPQHRVVDQPRPVMRRPRPARGRTRARRLLAGFVALGFAMAVLPALLALFVTLLGTFLSLVTGAR